MAKMRRVNAARSRPVPTPLVRSGEQEHPIIALTDGSLELLVRVAVGAGIQR